MKRYLIPILAAVTAWFVAVPIIPAQATVNVWMCQVTAAGTASGPRQWKQPGVDYRVSLNNQGCGRVRAEAINAATAAGFIYAAPFQTASVMSITTSGSVTLPAGSTIYKVIVQETSGGATPNLGGGFRVGTTNGGTNIINTTPMSASATRVWRANELSTTGAPNTNLHYTAQQQIFFDTALVSSTTAFTFTVVYSIF